MNELINTMSTDMGITPYNGESSNSFVFRVIYSALGRWCLESARGNNGISKHGQSIMLNNLIEKYTILYPEIKDMLVQDNQPSLSVFIRHVYEETGFLITDSDNHNHLARYHRGIEIGEKKMLFGLSSHTVTEGLGSFSDDVKYLVPWREVLIRDSLKCEDYLSSSFDVALFSQRDIPEESLQFFNPKTNTAPSSSWINTMPTDKTVARNTSNGVYYKVMRYNGEILYYDDVPNTGTEGLTDFEYRRLYYALKKYYGYPLKAQTQSLDNQYLKITLGGFLPNREYFLLLLCSWPSRMYCNKGEFITKKENICFIEELFENLGIELKGG